MHKMTRPAVLLAATLGLTAPVFAGGPMEIADIALETTIAGSGPAVGSPGINIRLLDLGYAAGSGFDLVKNWMELQITTTGTLEPPPYTPTQLASFWLSGYPTVGQVVGLGSLSAGEYATAIYLNINESAIPDFDYSRLGIVWAGSRGFPYPGANPTSILAAPNGFSIGDPGGAFDVMITFGANALGPDGAISSSFVFTYDGGATNIDTNLFEAVSVGGSGAYVAAARVSIAPGMEGFIGGTETVLTFVPEVPEPETYALMALGLLGVGFAVRRQPRS